jgi:uncharacterized protein YndB with AHSA1/START domain
MTIDAHRDTEARTLTITTDLPTPPERAWQLWADPRQLERWWGPPTYPATVTDHDLSPGGWIRYFMTSPEGERHHGYMRIGEVDEPRRLTFQDGFADADGNPNSGAPVMDIEVKLAPTQEGTAMAVITTFDSAEAMEQMIEQGMEEGMVGALGQIEAILAEG